MGHARNGIGTKKDISKSYIWNVRSFNLMKSNGCVRVVMEVGSYNVKRMRFLLDLEFSKCLLSQKVHTLKKLPPSVSFISKFLATT